LSLELLPAGRRQTRSVDGTGSDYQTVGTTISDNDISLVGVEYEDEPGIFIGYSKNTAVTKNNIHNLPYSGISSGYGFYEPSYMSGNSYTDNYVHDVMQVLCDGGAIYTENNQGTSTSFGQVSGNLMTNVQPGPGGLAGGHQGYYPDLGTGYTETRDNVFYNIGSNWYNSWTSGPPQ